MRSNFLLDFAEALKREPANESVKEELKKVMEQLAKQNNKVRSFFL
jgi:adenylosuccinate lyase